jgi:predicted ATPase
MMFVDIEGSTSLLQDLGRDYATLITLYRAQVRAAVSRFSGKEESVSGDGFFLVFEEADAALNAALAIQKGLEAAHWPHATQPRARIGIHVGNVRFSDEGYIGLDVHRAARIGEAGHGGQIILSQETVRAIDERRLVDSVVFRDLGAHRLKSLCYPEILFDATLLGSKAGPISLRTLESQPTNLPRFGSHLIGRSRELRVLKTLLAEKQRRLVTITGPGGTGKTCLGMQAAREILPDFPAGVFLVELAAVEDEHLVAAEIAQTLGLRDNFSGGAMEALIHHLRPAEMLLLLDNYEQVIGSRHVVRDLLRHCPKIVILVTSREPLAIKGERVFLLDTLACPSLDEEEDLGAVASAPAVQLFLERVCERDPSFELDITNAPVVSQICRRLDGLPLAIELAAARIKILSPVALLQHMSLGLDIIRGGPELDERHRTLWDLIEWSYRLLNHEEQKLLQAMAIFPGVVLFETIESVCGGLPWLDCEILDGLSALVDKNLLVQRQISGERRLGMLESIRQFALEKLSANGHLDEMRRLLGTYFIELAESMAPRLLTSDQRLQVSRLLDEQDQLREALAWSMEGCGDAAYACRGVKALLWFWISRGMFAEGTEWVERGIVHAETTGNSIQKTCMLDASAWLRIFMGDYDGALPYCRSAHDLFCRQGAPADIARTKMTLGITLAVTGDETNGPPLMVQSLEMFRELGDDNGTALALIALGEGCRAAGDLQAAEELYNNALAKLVDLDNVYWPAHLLQNLAHIRLCEGDTQAAREFLTRSMEYARTYDYPMITTLCLSALGGVAMAIGQPETAARVLGLTRRRLEEMGAHFEPLDRAAHEGYVDLTQQQLGDHTFERLAAEGMQWSLLDALETARSLGF